MKGFHALRRLPEEKITDKISRRVLVGDKEMVVWWSMKAGAHAAAHTHPHEQIFWLISGTMEFRLGGEKRTCRAGDRSEEHTSELQSQFHLVCRLLLEKKKNPENPGRCAHDFHS